MNPHGDRKNRNTRETAASFFSCLTKLLINPTEAINNIIYIILHRQDQINAIAVIRTFSHGLVISVIAMITAATIIGKVQYPSKQIT